MSIRRNISKIGALICLPAALLLCKIGPLEAQTPLEERIRSIIAESSLADDRTGVAVVLVEDGRMLASINADTPLNPASCAKLITTAAALSQLGPDYRFETVFYADGPASQGSIHNLYIKGNGDPSFVTEELYRTAYELSKLGIKSISGDIVIDDTFFDGPYYPRKDMGSDNRAFTALTSAVAVNFNSVKFIIAPGNRMGRKAEISTEPPTSYINIINKVVTGNKFRLSIAPRYPGGGGETYVFSGTIPLKAPPQFFYRTLSDPVIYSGHAFKAVLGEFGITSNAGVRKGQVPQTASEILRVRSKPLSQIVRDMNKFSNNFIAEQITKHVGAVKKGRPGSTSKGTAAFGDYLSSIGVNPDEYVLENGSGLSSVNRISPKDTVKMLRMVYRNREIRSDFIDSLSVLGVDGTMEKWRSEHRLSGILRAKTGSLADVSALAGYIPTGSGKMAAFAIYTNGFKKGRLSARDAQLKIVSAITEEY
jgi:D-alanyl-D-alanine carboxypeptidase/D-alanyl-D-alanine-endopeptidase (penicillin-binding protein 4)